MNILRWWGKRVQERKPHRAMPAPSATHAPGIPAFVVLDVETTGLSPKHDRVVELAIVRLDTRGKPIDEWSTRLNPEGPVGATHIHGIRQSDVDSAPLFRDLAPTIAPYIAGLPIAAHNARFDLAFLRTEFRLAGWDLPWLAAYCTLDASHVYLPQLQRRRLVDCCWAADVRLDDAHSALGDARATAALLRYYLSRSRTLDETLSAATTEAKSAQWPAGPARAHVSPQSRVQDSRGSRTRIPPQRPARPKLIAQLNQLDLIDVLDEGAPEGALTYVETLLEALEDGVITEAEAKALEELVAVYGLAPDDVETGHRALLLALAHLALDDGHVSKDERTELLALARALGVAPDEVTTVIARADSTRVARLGAGLGPLPAEWSLGEPLRVGDKVAFTGCDEDQRLGLERRAESLGVRVMGNVSRRTAMLVTDGNFSGTKLTAARSIGTRLVHPEAFATLLTHLQPALVRPLAPVVPRPDAPPPSRAPGPREGGEQLPAAHRASPSQIRSWAIAQGYDVGARGRLPAEVIHAHAMATATS